MLQAGVLQAGVLQAGVLQAELLQAAPCTGKFRQQLCVSMVPKGGCDVSMCSCMDTCTLWVSITGAVYVRDWGPKVFPTPIRVLMAPSLP